MKKMRIPLRKAHPGMTLADDVYNDSDQLILPEGTILTEKAITRLKLDDIIRITIDSSAPIRDTASLHDDMDTGISHIIDKRSHSVILRESKDFKVFTQKFELGRSHVEKSLTSILNTQTEVETNVLLNNVDHILTGMRNGFQVFDMLHNLKSYDDSTFTHSLNVSLICNVMGKWLDMSASDIQVLTVAGMLHDIGKLKIPDNIMKKPGALTPVEFSVVKAHTMQGYNILNPNENLDVRIKNAALMHHEKFDGSGYPFGATGNEIDIFARIVSLADVYDAITSPRAYRPALCPFEAIRILEQDGLKKYDPKIIFVFLKKIAQTYIGNSVRLNNGLEGKIVYINANWISRPMLQLSDDDDEYLDLSNKKHLHLMINELI